MSGNTASQRGGAALRAYNAVLPFGRAAARLAAPLRPKLRAGIAGRAGLPARLAALGADHGGRIVWFHATSVGEYEQARPLTAMLREHHPELAILQTFFSPSGYEYARKLGEAAHVEYLPEDTPDAVAAALDALRPRALVFWKFDLWPNLIVAAARRGVPLLLLDATLQPHSWRSRWPARALYRDLYARFDIVSAVTETDAARFRALVPAHAGIFVDGDTRYDQVARRRAAAPRTALAPALTTTPRPWTLVAGSTWPPDEAIVVPAWREAMRDTAPGTARLVLVPHEPLPAHLAALEQAVTRSGGVPCRYSEVEAHGVDGADTVLVDRVGILAEIYAAGDAAYVGGAFTTGVHNLMEPAIMGLPLAFGPRHHNAPEARMLLDAGAGSVVRSAADLARTLVAWKRDPELRSQVGGRARAAVEANLGAVARCYARLAPFLTEAP
jgi:3-deoxy-D-manno-octulosonic-acid transferase